MMKVCIPTQKHNTEVYVPLPYYLCTARPELGWSPPLPSGFGLQAHAAGMGHTVASLVEGVVPEPSPVDGVVPEPSHGLGCKRTSPLMPADDL